MKYYRIGWKNPKMNNQVDIFIASFEDKYSIEEITMALNRDICELKNEQYPSFAMEEITEAQMLRDKIKGVIVV